MGRNQENPMRKHFSFNAASNKSTCQVEGCGIEIIGNHGGNLQRHIQRRHPELFEKSLQDLQNPNKRPAADGQNTLDSVIVKKPRQVQVALTPETLKEACLELVTVNGRPFSLMEDSGFRKIIDPIQNAMGKNVTINSSNIRDMVSEIAQDEREKLETELSGRLLMLKIDSATCRDRSVLGINVQYSDGKGVVLRTLAVRDLTERHTSEYISSVVMDVLRQYNISLQQVYSVTSDNGANMLKAVSLLSDIQERAVSNEDATCEETEEIGEDVKMVGEDEGSQEEPILQLDSVSHGHVLRSVRCAAHTLQLAVDDSLKQASNIIAKARRVAKRLRSQNVVCVLKRMGHKRAIVDCATRWHSTHDMLQRLLELKTFCEDMAPTIPDLHLSESEWEYVSNTVDALKPAKIATKCLQSDQLTAGEFYGVWLKCSLDTEKLASPFARKVAQCIKARQSTLFDNDAFIAAVFLDPRYRLFLTECQTEKAKIHLYRTWEAIQNLEPRNAASGSDVCAAASPTQSQTSSDDEIEHLLMEKERDTSSTQRRPHVSIVSLLDTYSKEARLRRTEDLFQYWARYSVSNPDLYKLAMSVIPLPVTQVSVERAFSSLKFILSPLRSSLNEKVLEDILLVRLNKQYGL
ncbi:hypothetical protein PBY51_020825 [Eleginops maclovinus]|uniref:HAT C-terminal dimerisation domain-containing protein n=2 Tax=Eleginops maclovinus TaxID=56733 RepID=A0AAN8ATH7_ELEMC|nr:hypothetical protein PBY51_020825 [Eleginops maclovinus]